MDGTAAEFTITALGEHIGAEAAGIDLAAPVDDAAAARLRQAVTGHVALVVRDQDFTPASYLNAARIFGPPMEQHFAQYRLPGHHYVHEVSNRHTTRAGAKVKHGASWHTDHTNHERPPKYTVLYAVELPDTGGDTGVVNTRAAYEALPEDMKCRIDGMRTVNVFQGSAALRWSAKSMEKQQDADPDPVLQPLVRTHPDTGAKALYFHTVKTENIVGMTPEDSQALLGELLEHIVKPEFIYRHSWRRGDMLIWDNRCAMHQAYDDYDQAQHRMLHRIIIEGERPV